MHFTHFRCGMVVKPEPLNFRRLNRAKEMANHLLNWSFSHSCL